MFRKVVIDSYLLTCELCSHVWLSASNTVPALCPSCLSRAWNGPPSCSRFRGFSGDATHRPVAASHRRNR